VIFLISTGRTCMREASKDLALGTGSLGLTMYLYAGAWDDHSTSDRALAEDLRRYYSMSFSSSASPLQRNLYQHMAPPQVAVCSLVFNFCEFLAD
jgi:hypothetical protein